MPKKLDVSISAGTLSDTPAGQVIKPSKGNTEVIITTKFDGKPPIVYKADFSSGTIKQEINTLNPPEDTIEYKKLHPIVTKKGFVQRGNTLSEMKSIIDAAERGSVIIVTKLYKKANWTTATKPWFDFYHYAYEILDSSNRFEINQNINKSFKIKDFFLRVFHHKKKSVKVPLNNGVLDQGKSLKVVWSEDAEALLDETFHTDITDELVGESGYINRTLD